jgi:hypothetical protein
MLDYVLERFASFFARRTNGKPARLRKGGSY